MAANITEVNDSNFEAEVINSDIPTVVDFWATWCVPCKQISPVLEELAGQYDGKVKVVKMDVDQNLSTPQKFSITSIPTIMFFKNGEEADKVIGVRSKGDLTKMFDSVSS